MKDLRESPQKPPTPPPKPTLGARLYWARRLARAALRSIQALDEYRVFWEPVSSDIVPHYRSWVAFPLDFTTIRKRLVDGASPLELRGCVLARGSQCRLEVNLAELRAFQRRRFLVSVILEKGRQAGPRHPGSVLSNSRASPQLAEELQKDDWDLDEETRNFHKVLRQCLHDRERVAEAVSRRHRRDVALRRRRGGRARSTRLVRAGRVDGASTRPRATATPSTTHTRPSESPERRPPRPDPSCMGYVHWTFPDQTVEDQYPSYLMARRVRPLGDGVLRTTADGRTR